MEIMNASVELYVGAVVYNLSFDMLTAQQKNVLIDPYYICYQTVVHGAALHARFMYEDERVNIVFAEQPEFTGRTPGLWTAMKQSSEIGRWLGDMTISIPRHRAELQVADWVAFELAQHADKRVSRPDLPIRWPIRQMQSRDVIFKAFNHERLVQGFLGGEEIL
jgi:hypothetical protein